MKIFFWISFFTIIYSYGGYVFISLIILKLKPKRWVVSDKAYNFPTISLIIAAYNEESIIEEKIKNSKALRYDPSKLEIIFVTDGSTDSSPDIVSRYPEIRLLHENKRSGKSAAVNRAVSLANHEILVFCDANTDLNPDALLLIANHYEDPNVGGVSGEKKIKIAPNSAASGGEGIYWKYESFLKRMDSKLYSIVGAAGELFSVRKSLYEFIEPDTILDDFIISLRINLKGYSIVYEPGAFAEETSSASIKEEKKRKVRIAAGAFQSMGRLGELWKVWKNPRLSFLFISHKVLRWTLCPVFILTLFLSNLVIILDEGLALSSIYLYIFFLQSIFYLLATIGWLQSNRPKANKIFYIPYYFVFMNLSVFQGFLLFIRGKQSAVWDRSKRA